MPHYFFDFRDGYRLVADDEGLWLPDRDAAEQEAVLTLAEMAKEQLPESGRQREIALGPVSACS